MAQRVGTVARLFRYPVKSMRGEELEQTPVTLQGVPGDRRYAFVRGDRRSAFPWLTARDGARLLLYRPAFDGGYDGTGSEPALLVQTATGERFAVDDAALREQLEAEFGTPLFLLRDHRGNYDRGQLSLFDLGLAEALGRSSDLAIDPRRFRANIYLQPDAEKPLPETAWVGHTLEVGAELRVAVTERDRRCVMITLDQDGGADAPTLLQAVAQRYDNFAGVYAAVLRPGRVRVGDAVALID